MKVLKIQLHVCIKVSQSWEVGVKPLGFVLWQSGFDGLEHVCSRFCRHGRYMRNVLSDQDVFLLRCQVAWPSKDLNGLHTYSWCCFCTEAILHALVIRRFTDGSQSGVSEAKFC